MSVYQKRGKFYHGTSDAVDVGKYLLPPRETNMLREEFRRKLLDSVFLTISLRSAEMYAKKACKKYGGNPVVYIARPIGDYFINGAECVCKTAKILNSIKQNRGVV